MTSPTDATFTRRAAGQLRWLAALGGAAVIFAILVLPNSPDALADRAFETFPLEIIFIAALLVATRPPSWPGRAVRLLACVGLVGVLIAKLADFGLFMAFSRPFNFAYDLPLIPAGWDVLAGSSGVMLTALYAAGAVVALTAICLIAWWATGAISRIPLSPPRNAPAAISAVALAGMVAAAGYAPDFAPATRLVADHVEAALAARSDIAELKREAAADPADTIPQPDLLARLAGRDIVLVFVESYGRSSLDNPIYAGTTRAALGDIDGELAASGLVARSAWLTSPTFGGQSWLAHSTLLSGLRIDTQGRYAAVIRSPRKSLLKLATEAGWRTVGVMPAITKPWPEADFYGYDHVLAARDLGYKGLPFNWVTMPDQFTLSAFDRLELSATERKPVFAEMALISSHAPWTPIPKLVPWDAVGDGSIFDDQATSGDPPDVVWRDSDRVRDQFRQSIDYTLRALGGFAALHAKKPPLFIILGDHQPAAFVSGTPTDHQVPIHIIGDRETIARLDDWKWTPGMVPDEAAPDWPMEGFRERFVRAFSSSAIAASVVREPAA